MQKCEFDKNALQHLCGTAFRTVIFKEHGFVNVVKFRSYLKVVSCLPVTLTTDTLSKAFMDFSSVQPFSNILFVTGERVGWGAVSTLLPVFQAPEIVW